MGIEVWEKFCIQWMATLQSFVGHRSELSWDEFVPRNVATMVQMQGLQLEQAGVRVFSCS